MKFEMLKDALNDGKKFVRYQETDGNIVEGKYVRSVYLRVLSVEKGVHSNGYEDWDFVDATSDVVIEVTEFTPEKATKAEVVNTRVRFNVKYNIFKFMDILEFCKPSDDLVDLITANFKKQAIDDYARANVWCKAMNKTPLSFEKEN